MESQKPIFFLLGMILVVALLGAFSNHTQVRNTSTLQTSCATYSTSTGQVRSVINASHFVYNSTIIKINSVQAFIYNENGEDRVIFKVRFVNTANFTIYSPSACSSGLTIVGLNSQILRISKQGAVCLCAMNIVGVEPSQEYVAVTPGCWSGYSVSLLGHGSGEVKMELKLYSDNNFNGAVNIVLWADFDF